MGRAGLTSFDVLLRCVRVPASLVLAGQFRIALAGFAFASALTTALTTALLANLLFGCLEVVLSDGGCPERIGKGLVQKVVDVDGTI